MYTKKIVDLKNEYERARLLRDKELSLPEQERNPEVIGYYTAALHYLPQLITIYTLYRDLSINTIPKPVPRKKPKIKPMTPIHIEDTSYRAYKPDPRLVFEEEHYD